MELPLGDLAPVFAGKDDIDTPTGNYYALRLGQLNGTDGSSTALQFSDGNLGLVDTNGRLATDGQGTSPLDDRPALVAPSNLWTDLSQATAANINALRTAIQRQRWYEKLARSGNRYDELKYGLFGVRSMDSGKDRPLYLGGKRIPLNIEMVASTNGGNDSGTSEAAGSLGQLGAFSHTNDSDHYFYHSFDEWGTIMVVFCIRAHQTFSHGVDVHNYRRDREEFYFPTFAHLGEQLLDTRVISNYSQAFGYQQAWEELRQVPDRVSGFLRKDVSGGLGFMTYAENFSSPIEGPSLASFLDASRQVKIVDETLKVSSLSSGFQFIVQQTFNITARRPLPTYSIPGLMDHF